MLRDGIQFRRRQKNQSVIFGGIRRKIPDTYVKNGNARCRFLCRPPMRKFYGIPFRNDRIRSRSARSPRWRAFGFFVFAWLRFYCGRFLDCGFAFARNDETKYRFATSVFATARLPRRFAPCNNRGYVPFRKVGGGTRASRPTETGNDIPNEYLLAALYLRADEERPHLFSRK